MKVKTLHVELRELGRGLLHDGPVERDVGELVTRSALHVLQQGRRLTRAGERSHEQHLVLLNVRAHDRELLVGQPRGERTAVRAPISRRLAMRDQLQVPRRRVQVRQPRRARLDERFVVFIHGAAGPTGRHPQRHGEQRDKLREVLPRAVIARVVMTTFVVASCVAPVQVPVGLATGAGAGPARGVEQQRDGPVIFRGDEDRRREQRPPV